MFLEGSDYSLIPSSSHSPFSCETMKYFRLHMNFVMTVSPPWPQDLSKWSITYLLLTWHQRDLFLASGNG